jgi:adenosylcobinamide-phosphate synthase
MSEFFRQLHQHIFEPSRFPVVLGAFLLTAVIGMITGPIGGNANPWFWAFINKLCGGFGGRLDRKERKKRDLLLRGFFVTALALFFSALAGKIARAFIAEMPFYGVSEIILLSFAMTGGAVWFALLRLYFAMRDKKVIPGSYSAIALTTRTDLSGSDDYGITRAGMSLAARSFDKGLIAPALWYLIGGLPAAYIYAGAAAMAWRFGKDGFSKGFGNPALAFEKLLGFVPMVFSGILIALAGLFTPTGGMTRAFIGELFGKGRAKYEEGGLPVTGLAYALHVSLGGPVTDLDGSSLKRGWVGPEGASARLEKGHLRRALYINLMAHLLFILSLLGALLWSYII